MSVPKHFALVSTLAHICGVPVLRFAVVVIQLSILAPKALVFPQFCLVALLEGLQACKRLVLGRMLHQSSEAVA
jgi:hypothetical protein